MRKLIYAIAAVGALAWPGAAWAVLQETTVTLTDNGKPLPEATITLNRLTDSQPPPETKTEKTDDTGKVVIVYDDEDKKSDSTVEIIIKTSEGKTLTRRFILREFLTSETIDVAVPSETQRVSEPSQVTEECADLTNLDDQQLDIIVNNPELRERIVKLIEETEETEEAKQTEETKQTEEAKQTEQTEKAQEGKKATEKKSVSVKSKEPGSGKAKEKKKVVRKKGEKRPTASAAPKSGPGAAEIVGTGLSIGLGIARSRQGHDAGRRGHGMGSGHSKGME